MKNKVIRIVVTLAACLGLSCSDGCGAKGGEEMPPASQQTLSQAKVVIDACMAGITFPPRGPRRQRIEQDTKGFGAAFMNAVDRLHTCAVATGYFREISSAQFEGMGYDIEASRVRIREIRKQFLDAMLAVINPKEEAVLATTCILEEKDGCKYLGRHGVVELFLMETKKDLLLSMLAFEEMGISIGQLSVAYNQGVRETYALLMAKDPPYSISEEYRTLLWRDLCTITENPSGSILGSNAFLIDITTEEIKSLGCESAGPPARLGEAAPQEVIDRSE